MTNELTQSADLADVTDNIDGLDHSEPSTRLTAEEKNRRKRIRTAIKSPKQPNFYEHLKGSLYDAAPSLDILDEERIIDLFECHKYDYAGAGKRPAYLAWAAEWVGRVARLTVMVNTMLPDLQKLCVTHPGAARQVLLYLDRYPGPETPESLFEWASARALRTEQNTIMFHNWYANPDYQHAVRAGVWEVLRACTDLGLDTASAEGGTRESEVARMLCDDTWRIILFKMDDLADTSETPTADRLHGRAYYTAQAWKSAQLAHRKKFVTTDKYIRLADLQQLADDNPFTLSILKYTKDAPTEPDEDDEPSKELKKPEASEKRRCVACGAVLASWNKSAKSICIPCWQSSRTDETGSASLVIAA